MRNIVNKNDVVPRVLCKITLHIVTSSSNHLFVLRELFLAQYTQSNARVACFSFVRHILNVSHEGGKGCTLNSPSIRVSDIHDYMAQE